MRADFAGRGPIRAGAVSYLNTKPLIKHLPALAPEIDLSVAVPSALARQLAAGELEVALIPAIEYFRAADYTIVPGVSISSFGPVLSVKVCSRVPPARIRRLLLDEGSRTSVALADIILYHLFRTEPETQILPIDRDPLQTMAETPQADAVLVIGDRAMRVPDGSFPYTLDLGYEWSRWTGLPFVFAFWAVRAGVTLHPDTLRAFVEAKERGRPEIPAIAAAEAHALNLDVAQCQFYLSHVIRHDFGDQELAGLRRFYDLAADRGLAPDNVLCQFHPVGEMVG